MCVPKKRWTVLIYQKSADNPPDGIGGPMLAQSDAFAVLKREGWEVEWANVPEAVDANL